MDSKQLAQYIDHTALTAEKTEQDILEQCKQYMKKNTLKHCEEVEKYYL